MKELSASPQHMSSREIAELYGKPHSDTLKKIRIIEDAYIQAYGNEGKFSLVEYRDAKGEMRPEVLMNKSQALFVASRFDAVIHAKVQKRWEDLETGEAKPAMINTRPPNAHGLLEVDKAFRAALRMAKAIGLKDNAAVFSANRLARKVTGSDTLELLEIKAIETTVDNQPFTPTQIGATMGLTGRKVNELLEKEQFQTRIKTTKGTTWTPTAKGAKFAHLEDTGKAHSDGSPICQLKWKKTVLDVLNGSDMTIN